MSINKHHVEALQAYLQLLVKNATNQADLALKEHFAQELLGHLDDRVLTSETYRRAVDKMLQEMPPEYKKDAVLVARELFPFLMADVKSVATMMKTGGYRSFAEAGGAVTQQRIRTMPDLIEVAGRHAHSAPFTVAHEKYVACLRAAGLDDNAVAMRSRIAKALLYMSRDKTIGPEQYRAVVDRIMPAITTEPARIFFVTVAREFCRFLINHPEAPKGINVAARYAKQDFFG